MAKKTYYVSYRVEGRYDAAVEAESVEEARKLAERKFEEADFGELEDIGNYNTEQVNVTDEQDNILWEN